MRLVFAGTPPFAAAALAALADSGHEVVGVLTQPDRPAGRGMKLTASAVKTLALERGFPVAQPPSLREPQAQQALGALAPDVMVVAAYGLLLPPAVLAIPRHGCLNIHASLLPRWRGAAPVQRALLAGDAETGISIMQMDAGLDTGPVWLRRALPIGPRETAGSLLEQLSALGASMMVEALAALAGPGAPEPQPADGVTYAHKIDKREAAIDFAQPAAAVDRQVRAFDPVPGAFCSRGGELLKVWRAGLGTPAGPATPVGALPGTVLGIDERQGIQVACGAGSLWLQEVQRAGGRRQAAAVYAGTQRLAVGDRLDPGSLAAAPARGGPASATPGPG